MPEFVENDAELTLSLESSPTSATANNLTTTVEGYALDARQGYVLDNKKLDKSNVANNLNTIEEGKALDARQGKWLDENKVGYSAIANDLNTDDVKKVLSAAQGKDLGDRLTSLEKSAPDPNRVIPITFGGTGATDAPTARKNLGAVKLTMHQRVLEASNWITNDAGVVMYSLYIPDLLATDGVIASPHGNSRWYYNEMDMYAHQNYNGYMTFISNNGIPEHNVTVIIFQLREG